MTVLHPKKKKRYVLIHYVHDHILLTTYIVMFLLWHLQLFPLVSLHIHALHKSHWCFYRLFSTGVTIKFMLFYQLLYIVIVTLLFQLLSNWCHCYFSCWCDLILHTSLTMQQLLTAYQTCCCTGPLHLACAIYSALTVTSLHAI